MFWIIPSSPLFCPTLQADADPLPQKDPKMSVISFASCGLNLRLAFFFCRKSDESKGLIYADLCPDLLSPCMDSHHVGWAALSPRDFFQARMGSWKHVETLRILTSGLLHCRDVNKPSILPYLLPSCIRIRPCKRDSTLPFLPSVSSHFCWIKIFIDFIFVGISRFFGEWIIMRLTLMGFSGNFVWPDAVLSLPWLVYGRGVWFKILVPRKLSAFQSFQHELSVEDLRFWPWLSQVGVEGRINRHGPGTHFLGCKKTPSRWLDSRVDPGGTGREGWKRCLGALHVVWSNGFCGMAKVWCFDVVLTLHYLHYLHFFYHEHIFCFSLTS